MLVALGQKELILFIRSVFVTYIFRLLDTDRYSVVAGAPTFQVAAARMPHGGALVGPLVAAACSATQG
jgi:hypothetical protein